MLLGTVYQFADTWTAILAENPLSPAGIAAETVRLSASKPPTDRIRAGIATRGIALDKARPRSRPSLDGCANPVPKLGQSRVPHNPSIENLDDNSTNDTPARPALHLIRRSSKNPAESQHSNRTQRRAARKQGRWPIARAGPATNTCAEVRRTLQLYWPGNPVRARGLAVRSHRPVAVITTD